MALNDYEKAILKGWKKINTIQAERDRALEWATNHRKVMSTIMKLDKEGKLDKVLEGYR
jgi:hypothetical protein